MLLHDDAAKLEVRPALDGRQGKRQAAVVCLGRQGSGYQGIRASGSFLGSG